MSARASFAPERQARCCPLHGLRSPSALERVPDNLVESVRIEERLQVVNARITVGGEQLVYERRALPAKAGARHKPRDVPCDWPDAHVFEIAPEQPALGAQQIRHRDVAMKSLRGQ